MQQLTIFDVTKKITIQPAVSRPVPVGKYMSIRGLIYSLESVEGWVEVENLCILQWLALKETIFITEKAWVRPDGIKTVFCQEYREINMRLKKEGKKLIKPIAWGFGPEFRFSRNSYERGSFGFKNYEDYLWIKEEVLKTNNK